MPAPTIPTAFIAAAIAAATLTAGTARAEDIRTERVRFEPGASSATIRGTITGYEGVDYVLGAKAGQTMTVTMKTDHGASYFNVLPPGSDAAIAIGTNVGNEWAGTLPADGDYTIRVYLMRSAARRKEKASYTLSVGVTGHADAKVAGTPYHATGTVPCSVGPDPRGSAQCSFGVIRGGAGNAEVHLQSSGFDVTLHKAGARVLEFAGDKVTSANPAEKVTSEKQGDNWSIGVNDFYFYVIPEAVIAGG
jgi:hypothetical protein